MDPSTIGNITDSTLLIQAATAAVVATLTSAAYDIAQGATLVNGAYSPGAGGAAMMVTVPINSYAAANTLTLTATGGTYTLSINTSAGVQTTAALAYNANAAAIATAVNALACVQATGLTATVTGTGPFTITLPPALQVYGNQANPLTVQTVSLTGGSAAITLPTYTFVVNESPDQITWRPCSPAKTVAQHNILPTGDYFINLMVQSRQRYLQFVLTPAGTAATISIGNVYLQPFVNKFGG